MSTETQAARFTEAEKVIFMAWLVEHPNVVKSKQNATLFGNYLQANNLRCTLGNLNKAFGVIRAQLEIVRTPQEIEEAKIQQIREIIYADVAQRIAPAKIEWTPFNVTLLSKWLMANRSGRMSVAYVEDFLKAEKFNVEWQVEPAGLAQARKAAKLGYEDSRGAQAELSASGRRNYANDDERAKEIAAKKKEWMNDLGAQRRDEEKRQVEQIISSYEATCFNRTDRALTEIIQGLLRAYVQKFGADNIRGVIRELPDNPQEAHSWLRRTVGTGFVEPEPRTSLSLAPKLR